MIVKRIRYIDYSTLVTFMNAFVTELAETVDELKADVSISGNSFTIKTNMPRSDLQRAFNEAAKQIGITPKTFCFGIDITVNQAWQLLTELQNDITRNELPNPANKLTELRLCSMKYIGLIIAIKNAVSLLRCLEDKGLIEIIKTKSDRGVYLQCDIEKYKIYWGINSDYEAGKLVIQHLEDEPQTIYEMLDTLSDICRHRLVVIDSKIKEWWSQEVKEDV